MTNASTDHGMPLMPFLQKFQHDIKDDKFILYFVPDEANGKIPQCFHLHG